MMNRAETIKRIKAALRKRSGKAWSVKGGRGTDYGWITITTAKDRLACNRWHRWDATGMTCRDCQKNYRAHDIIDGCQPHVCDDKCYRQYISPEEQTELSELLGVKVHHQGVQIAASSGHYDEYTARAEGRTPTRYGEKYWAD